MNQKNQEPLPEDLDTGIGDSDRAGNIPKLLGADIELGGFILGMNPGEDYRDACDEASVKVLRRIRKAQGTRAAKGVKTARPADNSVAQGEWRSARDEDDYDEYSGSGAGNDSAHDRDNGRPTRRRLENENGGSGYRYRRYDSVDWGRSYLPTNGGCCYIDQTHLELCTPEVLSAADHVAAWHAMMRIAAGALKEANREMPPGRVIKLLVNNSDGKGNAYGSHVNVLITRRAWDNIFRRKLHHLLYLASFFASGVVYTGQGKVGVEDDPGAAVAYQLSQRADFFTKLMGHNTIFDRGMVNMRNEALCGGPGYGWTREERASLEKEMARLHIIIHDNTLCHGSSYLKVGTDQIVLAMIEAEEIDPNFILDDPVQALRIFSRDPRLKARARMATGKRLTAVELQLLFCERARRFVEAGRCEGIVPDARRILNLWEDTLLKLQAGNLPALVGRLDWVLKLFYLTRARNAQPALGWDAPQLKYLDQIYSSLDPNEGLYLSTERAGLIERVVGEERIEHFMTDPPEDTRAWTRAMLLRKAGEAVQDVDWDEIKVQLEGKPYPNNRTVKLANPLESTRAHNEMVFTPTAGLEDVLEGLGASVSPTCANNTYYGSAGYGGYGGAGYGYGYGYGGTTVYGYGYGYGQPLPAGPTPEAPQTNLPARQPSAPEPSKTEGGNDREHTRENA